MVSLVLGMGSPCPRFTLAEGFQRVEEGGGPGVLPCLETGKTLGEKTFLTLGNIGRRAAKALLDLLVGLSFGWPFNPSRVYHAGDYGIPAASLAKSAGETGFSRQQWAGG